MLTVRECSSIEILRIQGAGPALLEAGAHTIVPAAHDPAAAARSRWTASLVGLNFMLDMVPAPAVG